MADQSLLDKIVELVKIVLPVFTFYAGYRLSVYREKRKLDTKLGNIRIVLLKEMRENYMCIIEALPNKEQQTSVSEAELARILSIAFEELSRDVYDTYLDNLCDLTEGEVDKIYNAYTWIRRAGKQQYQQAHDEATEMQKQHANRIVLVTGYGIQKSFANAIALFKGGQEILKDLETKQGLSYRRDFE